MLRRGMLRGFREAKRARIIHRRVSHVSRAHSQKDRCEVCRRVRSERGRVESYQLAGLSSCVAAWLTSDWRSSFSGRVFDMSWDASETGTFSATLSS